MPYHCYTILECSFSSPPGGGLMHDRVEPRIKGPSQDAGLPGWPSQVAEGRSRGPSAAHLGIWTQPSN